MPLLDIRTMPKVLDAINAIINNKGIAEVRSECTGIAVIETIRRFRAKEEFNDNLISDTAGEKVRSAGKSRKERG